MGVIIYEIKVNEAEFNQLEQALRGYIAGLEKERNKANNKVELEFIQYKIESSMRALKALRRAWIDNLYES
jgi:hypothetical protein